MPIHPRDELRRPALSNALRIALVAAVAAALGGCVAAAPSDSESTGSRRSASSCGWSRICDEPIFGGPSCQTDADCQGDRYCVEQHCFGGVTSNEFSEIIRKHTGSPEVGGNRTDLLVDNRKARKVRHELVRSAEHSVHLSALAIKDDEQAELLVERLVDAVERGVEVRVLVDAATHYGTNFGPLDAPGSLLASGYERLQVLSRAGVDVLPFNPPKKWWRLRFQVPGLHVNSRLHEKFLIVDGKDAVIGGRNIGKKYLERDEGWRDICVHVRGPGVTEMQRIFLRTWDRTAAWEHEAGCPNESSYGLHCPSSPNPSLAEDPAYFPDVEPAGDARTQTIYSAPFLQDPSHGHFTTVSLVRAARESVTIANAFFIPPRELRRHLRMAADRGVDVTLLKNSKESQFFNVMYYAGLNYYRELIDAGVDIYEYEGPMLHAKTMIVDGELAVVGSYNLDPRSAVDHSEAMVLLEDARAIEQLQKAMDTMLGNATKASSRLSRVEQIKARAHRVAERWL